MTLKQYCHGSNEAKRVAKIEIENVLKQLAKYVGKKIFTINGKYTKAFKVEFIKPVPIAFKQEFKGQKVYAANHGNRFEENYKFFRLFIKLCFSAQPQPTADYSGAHYFNENFDIGKCENGILIELFTFDKICQVNHLDDFLNEQEEAEKINTYTITLKHLEGIKATIKAPSEYIPKHS